MANKSASMLYFVIGLVVLGPVGLISGFFSLGWAWDSISGCFLNASMACGQTEWFKAFIFGAITYGCFTSISKLWNRTK